MPIILDPIAPPSGPATPPDYCALADLENRLGISAGDTREPALQFAVTAASRWVEKQTARRFYVLTETRYYSASWHYDRHAAGLYGHYPWAYLVQHIAIDDFVSVTALQTDDNGDGSFPSTWTVGRDYWLGPRNAAVEVKPFRSLNRNQATGVYVFPAWENSIAVSGACGYSVTVPDQIRELTIQVAMLFSRPILEMSIPGVDNYQLTSDIHITMSPEELPLLAQAVIQQFRDPIVSR